MSQMIGNQAFPICSGNLANMCAFIESQLTALHISPNLSSHLELASEEALTNIILYSGLNENSLIHISFFILEEPFGIQIVITDDGIPFNPLLTNIAHAHIKMTVEARPIGGLGIFLMKMLMDKIEYKRINGKNVLTLTKLQKL